MQTLSNEDKDILLEMLNLYKEHLESKKEAAAEFVALAHETGDIASSGEKYTENVKFWHVKDNIKTMLDKKKSVATKIIHNLIYS